MKIEENQDGVDADQCAGQDTRQQYWAYKEKYEAGYLDFAKTHDKWLLTASGAALAISVSFREQIASANDPAHYWCLIVGWGLLVCSTSLVLVSFALSRECNRWFLKDLDDVAKECSFDDPKFWCTVRSKHDCRRSLRLIDWLNWLSLAFFIFGVSAVVVFATFNSL